jgi:hypothetical protein
VLPGFVAFCVCVPQPAKVAARWRFRAFWRGRTSAIPQFFSLTGLKLIVREIILSRFRTLQDASEFHARELE